MNERQLTPRFEEVRHDDLYYGIDAQTLPTL
jgi:hypothetical protein